jgi:uncharacterized protein (TIGR03437 family)
VTISGTAPSGGTTVSLSSNDAKVTVPPSVVVAAGQTSARFFASVAAVSTSQWAAITAETYGTSLIFTLQLTSGLRIDSVANSASYSTDVVCSAGSLASAFGSGFTIGVEASATRMPLPTKLAGVGLKVNGLPAPLIYVSDQLINFQCPNIARVSPVTIVVTGANGETAKFELIWDEASPGIFSMNKKGQGQGVVLVAGTSLIAGPGGPGSRPAQPGEYIEVFATGLGPTYPLHRRSVGSTMRAVLPVSCTIGDKQLESALAERVLGLDGLWHIYVQLPTDITMGAAVPLQVNVKLSDGTVVSSNIVTIAIGPIS